jgi:protein-disulfide isomerase
MRHAIAVALAAGLAFSSSGCSHGVGTGDPSPTPPLPGLAPDAVPAGVLAAVPVYRVPVDGLPSMGDARALVTIVAFTDYQCPYCRRAEATLAQLRQAYGAELRIVVAEKPLPMHDRARPAAIAALAASAQGQFEAMRARLFAGPLDDASIALAAHDLGLDADRFDADRAAMAATALAGSEALAGRLGVKGTPTFFINGRHLVGAQPIETFRAVIDERLAAARALVAGGVKPADVYARTVAGGAEHVEETGDDHGPGCGGDSDCKEGKGNDVPTVGDAVEAVPIEHAPSRGPARATITVVEFADFQCPFCARAEATVHAVEQAHPHDVRVVFKNLPLPFHDQARPMARAALAADAQGRFWEMHDRLFALTGPADRAALDRVAREAGLDVARFDRDLDDASLDARLDADSADAAALGVKGTPTFFVNGHRIVGAQPPAVFERAIAKR